MSTNFQFEVDTHPMGESLMHVAGHVSGATAAVEASSFRIVEAEQQAAQRVSYHITQGFQTLILSQLSQKLAAKKASVDAKSAQLVAEKRAAELLEVQFLGDFNRIKARYHHLFESLNKALKVRIEEIDKPVFQLVEKEYRQKIWGRSSVPVLPVLAQQEYGDTVRILEIGKAKGQISRLIDAMKGYLIKTHLLKKQIVQNLLPSSVQGVRDLSLPCLVMESSGSLQGSLLLEVRLPEAAVASGMPRDWESAVRQVDWNSGTWRAFTSDETAALEGRFVAELEKSALSLREREFALTLLRSSSPQLLDEVPR